MFRLLRAVLVYFLEPLADIFLVFLATFVKIDAGLIVGDPTLAEIAELAALRLPIVRPGITISYNSRYSSRYTPVNVICQVLTREMGYFRNHGYRQDRRENIVLNCAMKVPR